MSAFKIVQLSTDHVFCLVTNDDGSAFVQSVSGEARKTLAGIAAVVAQAIQKLQPPAVAPGAVAKEVTDALSAQSVIEIDAQGNIAAIGGVVQS